MNLELAAEKLGEHRQARIVIAGNVDETSTRAAFRQQCPNYIGVLSAPEESVPELQGIDDVADENDALGIDAGQKFRQFARAGPFVPEMNVGEKQRADFDGSS